MELLPKSDIMGKVLTLFGKDWSPPGICYLLTTIRNHGYPILYLTAQAIGQADITRDFVHPLKQAEKNLPLGPVIILFCPLLKEMSF